MQEDVGFSAWFRSYWHVVTATACSLILVGFLVMPAAEKQESATILLAEKVSQSSDYQVIINFDELLASEESSIWLEN